MPTGYQIKDQSLLHYLTFQVVFWVDLFSRQVYRVIVVDSHKYCQRKKERHCKCRSARVFCAIENIKNNVFLLASIDQQVSRSLFFIP